MPLSGEQPSYLGCFLEDVSSPDLTGEPPLIIARPEACFTHCSIGTWSYAAIRNKTICTCGDTFNKYGVADSSLCSSACPEEQSIYDDCGGPMANSIYRVGLLGTKLPFPTPSILPFPDDRHPSEPFPSTDGQSGDEGYTRRKTRSTFDGGYGHGSTHDSKGIEEMKHTAGQSWFSNRGWSKDRQDRGRDKHDDRSNGTSTGTRNSNASNGSNSSDSNNKNRGKNGNSQSGPRAVELQLFEGFESSVMQEDYQQTNRQSERRNENKTGHQRLAHSQSDHQHDSVEYRPAEYCLHPLESCNDPSTIGATSMTNSSSMMRQNSVQSSPSSMHGSGSRSELGPGPQHSQEARTLSITPASQSVAQLASKLGQKLGHLRVKTHLSEPTTNGATSAGLNTLSLPPPISPISPVSPTMPSPIKHHNQTWSLDGEEARGGMVRISETGGNDTMRNASSATPSFSSISEPLFASDRHGHGHGMVRSDIPTNLRVASSKPSTAIEVPPQVQVQSQSQPQPWPQPQQHQQQEQQHRLQGVLPTSPPSPISPTLSMSIPSPISPSPSSLKQNPKCQKEQRSLLIKDLILQGDSALDEKEQALMAQYQPYHCQQQQLLQQQQQRQQQRQRHQRQYEHSRRRSSATIVVADDFVYGTSDMTEEASLSNLIRHGSSSSSIGSRLSDAPPAYVPATPRSLSSSSPSSPSTSSTSSMDTADSSTICHRPPIPAIDTNFLAPPPLIYVHKPL
ncbi:Asialoglycoprotein receptor 1 [Podila epigama]|nr:Asialoglycoprotein receptor 1 [Podila epigama]